jgi:iron complex transport system permease protein
MNQRTDSMPTLPLPARQVPNALWFGLLAVLLLGLFAATSGPVLIPFWKIPDLLLTEPIDETGKLWRTILLEIRLPRIVMALVAGGGLAIAGTALQAMFRNPLAEPGLIGASSGAALAAALALAVLPHAAAAPAAFVGSLAATSLAWRIGRYHDAARLLLAGVAINALTGGLLALLGNFSNDAALRGMSLWALGSLAGAGWDKLLWLIPSVGAVGYLLWREAPSLDALLLGEREAFHLGHDLLGLRRRLVALTALMVALCVACCGALAFVGLLAPHIARRLIGPGHRNLLPGSALVGALTLLGADWVARTVVSPTELPLGAVLALLGAPFFLSLLMRRSTY